MSTSQVDKLLQKSLLGNYDDEEPWDAVRELRQIGTREVFECAALWCKSPDPIHRARGADILAQLGKTIDHPDHGFPDEAFATIAKALEHETHPQPLSSYLFALGHIDNPAAIPLLVDFTDHDDCEIRYAVACALGSFANNPISITALLKLTSDTDDDVRDWATFGLGVLGDADTTEIRQALTERLNDNFEDVRIEAVAGLGKRKDPRIIPILINLFEEPSIAMGYVEAAYELLGMEDEPTDWKGSDYIKALKAIQI